MKIEKKINFVPITITLETQEEIDKIYAIFSSYQIDQALNWNYRDECMDALLPFKSDKYNNWLKALKNILK